MRRLRRFLFLLAVPALFSAPAAQAQNFRPFTPLQVLETRYFDIIHPRESERTALRLAAEADAVFQRVTGLLDLRPNGRIPVVITPHTDSFNGYMNPLPYPHIVLFDTPMDIEWTVFADSLEGLFLHELTHVVSLSSRGPLFRALHGVFGGWVVPTALTAPLFMVEGVTVGFESLDGTGRVNDPEVRQRVRQAIHEGIALTPFQASGVYDKPPFGRAYYEYGGLFTAYILRTYGLDKYRELWAAMGRRIPLSLYFYRSGFFGLFRKVYGVEPMRAWEDFLASLALEGIEDAAVRPVVQGELLIRDIAAAGDRIFFLDGNSRTVQVYNTRTGERRTLISVDGGAYKLSVHPDGTRLLVSSYRYRGALARAVATEYSALDGRPTGLRREGLYGAVYFRDGFAAKASDLHGSRIVYLEDGEGDSVALDLVPVGNARRIYSYPVALDRDRLAFIVAEGGVRRLGLLDMSTGTLSYAVSDLRGDKERWRHIRGLNASEGRLLFAYNHDDRMYKLGILDFDASGTAAVGFYDRDLSGGVASPVAVDSSVYYRAAFATWDALAIHPQTLEELAPVRSPVRWETREELWTAASQNGAEALSEENSSRRDAVDAVPGAKPYSALRYLNPLKFWIPFPLVRSEDGSFRIDGGGIITYLSDPTDQNTFLISAGGDLRAGGFGYFDTTWASVGFGLPTTLSLSDGLETDWYAGGVSRYRATRIAASALLDRGLGGEALRFRLKPLASALLAAPDQKDGSGAYEWAYERPLYAAGLAVGLSTLRRRPWQLFGGGAAIELMGRLRTDGQGPRWDAVFRAGAEPALPLRATLYGAHDGDGMSVTGKSIGYGLAPFADVASGEYDRDAPSDLSWIAGGEAELKLLSWELQRNLSHLYFNRIFATSAFRAVLHERTGEAAKAGIPSPGGLRNHQTLILRAGAVISAIPLASAPLRFSPHLWFALKLSDLYEDRGGAPYQAGVALRLEW